MRYKVLENFNPLDLSSVKKKDLVEARIVPTILLDNGFTFKCADSFRKVVMEGPGQKRFDLCFGVYNLWFLLHWVEFSLDGKYQGTFSRLDKEGNGKTIGAFAKGPQSSGDPCAYDPGSVFRPARLGDYWSFSDTAFAEMHGNLMPVARMAPNFKQGFGKLPAKAAYWKKIMDPRNVLQRRTWMEFLDQHGYSYRFNPIKTELYFSNARSASQGYPPNAMLLGLPKLDLKGNDFSEQFHDEWEEFGDDSYVFLSGQGEIVNVDDEDDLIESFKALNGIVDVESEDEGSSNGNGDSDECNSQ